MNVLALKLYVGHIRGESRVSKMIKINEDNIRLHYSFSAEVIDPQLEKNPTVMIWSDEIRLMLKSRRMQLINRINESK